MDILGLIVNIITMATFITSGYAMILGIKNKKAMILKEKVDNEKIKLFLKYGDNCLLIPYQPTRKNLTRPEVAGILGMFSGGKRYDLPKLSEVFYSGTFDKVLSGKICEIYIHCNEETYKLFLGNINESNENSKSHSN